MRIKPPILPPIKAPAPNTWRRLAHAENWPVKSRLTLATDRTKGTGLTGFLIVLQTADAKRIKAMDVEKTAKHFGAEPEHIAGYKAMALQNLGVR